MSKAILDDALEKYAAPNPDQNEDLFNPVFKDIAGQKIRYVRGPNRSGPNLVLLNGMPQSIRCWESSWQALTTEFNVLAFDMPGFGLSPKGAVTMSPRGLADLIPSVMDAFGFDDAYLVGPDVGAPVALATAIRHPDRLRGINIFDGPGFYEPFMDKTLLASIKYPFLRWLLGGPMKAHLAKLNFMASVNTGYSRFNPGERAIREYYKITHDNAQTRAALAFLGSYKQDLTWIGDNLQAIKPPVLITWGSNDQFVLPSNATEMHKRLQGSELHIFDGAGHYSHEDAGTDYTDKLITWCRAQENLSPATAAE